MKRFGAVELGGTKTLVAHGATPDELKPYRIETEDPGSTLGRVVERLRSADVSSVGVASFGPLELRDGHSEFGRIVDTPKPGWSGVDLITSLRSELGVPVFLDTDVNAAAVAEGRAGAATGARIHVYITVGTGVGVGVVVDGSPLRGLGHPEIGHVVVRHREDDGFEGACPYHGSCLEGMVAGPAVSARFGAQPSSLTGEEAEAAASLVAFYLAQGIRGIIYTLMPERIVVGGGLSALPGFHGRIRSELANQLGGYRDLAEFGAESYISAPGLGGVSGLVGAWYLAGGS